MGVNQQVFERYVNGDETALMGMPVQKQIKFRELRNVLSRFFGDYPERMKPEFAIALIDDQCFLMDKCNRAIEEAVVPEFLRTLVFARPRGDDQFADCTFSPSLDMSR